MVPVDPELVLTENIICVLEPAEVVALDVIVEVDDAVVGDEDKDDDETMELDKVEVLVEAQWVVATVDEARLLREVVLLGV